MPRTAALFLAAALALAAACAPNPAPGAGGDGGGIAAVRRMGAGAATYATGVVTAAPGAVGSGFAIQDGGAGLFVFAPDTAPYRPGERVRVTGSLAEEHGLLGIRPQAVERLGAAALPAPRRVRTADVGEGTESVLVEVEGAVADSVVDDRPYGWKVFLDDGSGRVMVFVTPASGIDVSGIRPGQRLRVVGVGGQYDDHHEVLPRSPADVRAAPSGG